MIGQGGGMRFLMKSIIPVPLKFTLELKSNKDRKYFILRNATSHTVSSMTRISPKWNERYG